MLKVKKCLLPTVACCLLIFLAGCKPGPIYLNGGPPSVVMDSTGKSHTVNYHVSKKRIVEVPPSTGSDLISNKIRAAFAQDPALSPYNIAVSAHRGEVTLMGKVPNDRIKSYAIKVARYTKGVLMVHADNLLVTSRN